MAAVRLSWKVCRKRGGTNGKVMTITHLSIMCYNICQSPKVATGVLTDLSFYILNISSVWQSTDRFRMSELLDYWLVLFWNEGRDWQNYWYSLTIAWTVMTESAERTVCNHFNQSDFSINTNRADVIIEVFTRRTRRKLEFFGLFLQTTYLEIISKILHIRDAKLHTWIFQTWYKEKERKTEIPNNSNTTLLGEIICFPRIIYQQPWMMT